MVLVVDKNGCIVGMFTEAEATVNNIRECITDSEQ